MIPFEIIPGMEGRGVHWVHCKNFCGCHNYIHPAQQLKKKRKEEKKWYPDYITNSKNLANHKQANF
jgi:hypothetical protein